MPDNDDLITVSTKFKDGIPAATYPATLSQLRTELHKDYGFGFNDFFHFDFTVEGPEKDVTISVMSTQKFSKKAKAKAIVEGLLGRPLVEGEQISRSALVGRPCLVTVTLEEDSGYNRITAVVPAPTRTRREVPE